MDSAAGEEPIADMLGILKELSLPVALGLVRTAGNALAAATEAGGGAADAAGTSLSAASGGGDGDGISSQGVGGVLGVAGVVAGAAFTLTRTLPGALRQLSLPGMGGGGSGGGDGDQEAAEEASDPDLVEGRARLSDERYTEAIECFDRAIEKNKEHKFAYNNRAVAYFYLGMYEPCITDCDTQMSIYPAGCVEALSNKAMALEELDSLDAAVDVWTLAIARAAEQKKPGEKRADLYNRRAQLWLRLGEPQSAFENFERGLAVCPTCEAYAGRADARLRGGGGGGAPEGEETLEASLADIRKALAVNPRSAAFRSVEGRVHAAFGDAAHMQLACDAFTAAIQLDGDLAEVYLNRAYVHRTCGRVEEALQDLSEAAARDPSNLMALIERADMISSNAADTAAHLRAVQEVNQVIERDPEHWLAYSTRGTVYHRMRRQKEALSDYNKALQLLSDIGGEGSPEHATILQNIRTAIS